MFGLRKATLLLSFWIWGTVAWAGFNVKGNLNLDNYNCTGNANGGLLTTNGSGLVSCVDRPSGGATSLTGLSDVGSANVAQRNILISDGSKYQSVSLFEVDSGGSTDFTGTNTVTSGLVDSASSVLSKGNSSLIVGASVNGGDTETSTDYSQFILGYNDNSVLFTQATAAIGLGYVINGGTTDANGVASLAGGYDDAGTLDSNGSASFAYGASLNASTMEANSPSSDPSGIGADLTFGYANHKGYLNTNNHGSIVLGSTDSSSYSASSVLSEIEAGGIGAMAAGSATGQSGTNPNLTKIVADGQGSIALGYANNGQIEATGSGSIAGGYSTTKTNASGGLISAGTGSVALGEDVQANANNSISIGKFMQNNTSSSFEVGFSGSALTTPALHVGTSNVGIGTSTPAQKLDVNGTAAASSFTAGTDIFDVGPTVSQALCLNAAHKISICTSVVGVTGGCTCP